MSKTRQAHCLALALAAFTALAGTIAHPATAPCDTRALEQIYDRTISP
jgi:hypothetical protein